MTDAARGWTLLPGADKEQARFGYGDGLIEAQTTVDGLVTFTGGFFDAIEASNSWQPEELRNVLAALRHATCGYWCHVPGAQWCLEAEEQS